MEIVKYQVSALHRPITNHDPCGQVSLHGIWRYETGSRAVETQKQLRSIADEKAQRHFKDWNFDWVTPCGCLSYANDQSILSYSGCLCMDLDYLCLPAEINEEGDPVTELKERLLKDPYFETLLLFRSPRGRGLKWWIPIDLNECDFRKWFRSVRNYLMSQYHLTEKQVDPTVGHESAGCYLGHDAHCYLKPELFNL